MLPEVGHEGVCCALHLKDLDGAIGGAGGQSRPKVIHLCIVDHVVVASLHVADYRDLVERWKVVVKVHYPLIKYTTYKKLRMTVIEL